MAPLRLGRIPSEPGKPIRIVEITDGKLQLHKERLRSILCQPYVADLAVVVISIVGAFRKGKSFLLNLLIEYLENLTTGSTNNNETIFGGFEWGGGQNAITNGIVMWSKPYVLENSRKQKFAVFLMDTQGEFDGNTDAQQTTEIFSLSTYISSVQIFNVSQLVQSNDVEHLHFCSKYARSAYGKDDSNLSLQKLLIAVRDWQCEEDHSFGSEGGHAYITEYLGGTPICADIRECFDVTGWLFPHPGPQVARQRFNGKRSVIEKEFLDQVQLLAASLFDPQKLTVKKVFNQAMTSRCLAKYFENYFKLLFKSQMPQVRSIYELTSKAHYSEVMDTALEMFQMAVIGNVEKVIPTLFNDILSTAAEVALGLFDGAPRFGEESLRLQYRQQLVDRIQSDSESLRQQNAEYNGRFSTLFNNFVGSVSSVFTEIGRGIAFLLPSRAAIIYGISVSLGIIASIGAFIATRI